MLAIVRAAGRGRCLITRVAYPAGEPIARIEGARIIPSPTRLSIQVSASEHIDRLGPFRFLNHSCRPSTVFRAEERVLVARLDLEPGDELTYFYPSTEWEMATPFRCRCGEPECLGLISGARYLDPAVREHFYLNPHIRDLIAFQDAAGAVGSRKVRRA